MSDVYMCVWVKGLLQAQLGLTACRRVVPNMPHLFREGQGANEHCLEGEKHERGKNSEELKNKDDIPQFLSPPAYSLIMQPQLRDTMSEGFHS